MEIEWFEDKTYFEKHREKRYYATALSFIDLEVYEERLEAHPDQERWAFSARTPWSFVVGNLIGGGYTEELGNAKALAIAIAKDRSPEWIEKQRKIIDWAIGKLDLYKSEVEQWDS